MATAEQTTKTEEAYRAIRDRVFTGEFDSGQMLSERRLTQHLGFTRSAVRAALHRLHGEGVIHSRGPYRSKQVLYLEDQDPRYVLERYEMREMIESHAARLAALNMNAWQVSKLRTLYRRAVEVESSGDRQAGYEAAIEFHEYLLANCGNSLMYKAWREQHTDPPAFRPRQFAEKLVARQMAMTGRRWEAVIDAIEARNANDAAKLMFEEYHALTQALRMGLEEDGRI